MYDCLREKEMYRPAPEKQEKRQRKEGDKRDINVVKTCREGEKRGTCTQRRF